MRDQRPKSCLGKLNHYFHTPSCGDPAEISANQHSCRSHAQGEFISFEMLAEASFSSGASHSGLLICSNRNMCVKFIWTPQVGKTGALNL